MDADLLVDENGLYYMTWILVQYLSFHALHLSMHNDARSFCDVFWASLGFHDASMQMKVYSHILLSKTCIPLPVHGIPPLLESGPFLPLLQFQQCLHTQFTDFIGSFQCFSKSNV